jgi:hypothetical protein
MKPPPNRRARRQKQGQQGRQTRYPSAPPAHLSASELLPLGFALLRRALAGTPPDWGAVLLHPAAPQAEGIALAGKLGAQSASPAQMRTIAAEVNAPIALMPPGMPVRPVLVFTRDSWALAWLTDAQLEPTTPEAA